MLTFRERYLNVNLWITYGKIPQILTCIHRLIYVILSLRNLNIKNKPGSSLSIDCTHSRNYKGIDRTICRRYDKVFDRYNCQSSQPSVYSYYNHYYNKKYTKMQDGIRSLNIIYIEDLLGTDT